MSIRHLPAAITIGALTCGLAAFSPSKGSAQTVLPEKSAEITLTGCFLQQTVTEKGKQEEEYVLVRPVMGSLDSVPEATCVSNGNDQAIELEHVKDHPDTGHLDTSMLGRWIEVTGKLEKTEGANELREMNVRSFRAVPVVPPKAAEAAPAPEPAPPTIAGLAPASEPPAINETPAPKPVATTGELPKTASSAPLVGLIGILALAGASMLRLLGGRALTSGRH